MTTGNGGQIAKGADVFGADNEKIGKITEVGERYFLVQHGFLFHKTLYLPMRTVARADTHMVYLNVPKYEAEAMATEHLPAAGDAWYGTEDSPSYATTDTRDETDETDETNVTSVTSVASVTNEATAPVQPEPALEMPVAETPPVNRTEPATLQPEPQPQQSRNDNEALAAPTMPVAVVREDLHLLDRTVEIPLREQEVVIEKTAIVTSEISIHKETVTDTQHVTDTVRREEAHIEATDHTRIHHEGQPAETRPDSDAAIDSDDQTRYERLTEAERADNDRRNERKK